MSTLRLLWVGVMALALAACSGSGSTDVPAKGQVLTGTFIQTDQEHIARSDSFKLGDNLYFVAHLSSGPAWGAGSSVMLLINGKSAGYVNAVLPRKTPDGEWWWSGFVGLGAITFGLGTNDYPSTGQYTLGVVVDPGGPVVATGSFTLASLQ